MHVMVEMDDRAAFATRLQKACDHAGLPRKGDGRQTGLARLAKVSHNSARRWLHGEAMPRMRRTRHLADLLGVRWEWLFGGEGPMVQPEDQIAITKIPIIGTTERPVTSLGGVEDTPPLGYICLPSADPDAYALRANTSALAPRVRAGEAVLVEPRLRAGPGDEVVLGLPEGDIRLCEIVSLQARELIIEDLRMHQQEVIARTGVRFMHVVTGVFRLSNLFSAAS